MPTINELKQELRRRFSQAGIYPAEQESWWFLEGVLHRSKTDLVMNGEQVISCETAFRIYECMQRRVSGEPLQYILGNACFYDLVLEVGPGVFVPRAETEQLVALALEYDRGEGPVCDLCTGCGAIALALAYNLGPDRHVTGVDISSEALAFARRNRDKYSLSNVHFYEGDLFSPLPKQQFLLVTANPPYISEKDYGELQSSVRDHEPREALRASRDGLVYYERLLSLLEGYLLPGGVFLAEIGYDQGDAIRELMATFSQFEGSIVKDYAGQERFLYLKHISDY